MTSLRNRSSSSSSLKSKDEVFPLVRRKYIESGYLDDGNIKLAMCSCHNETANIYTHLLPLFIITCLFCIEFANYYYYYYYNINNHNHDILFVNVLYISSIVISFSFSTVYHISRCTVPHLKLSYFLMDVMGIFCMNMGFILSAIYVSFYCFPFWQWIYLSFYMAAFLFIIVPIFFIFPYSVPFKKRQIIQAVFNLPIIIPFIHIINLSTYDELIHFQNGTISMVLCAGIAVGIFYFDIPERWYPTKFDLIGWSHNWFHVASVFASFSWGYALNKAVKWRLDNPCMPHLK